MSKLRACRAMYDERGFDARERFYANLLRLTLNRPATRKVFVNVVSVSKSGLSRYMRLYVLNGCSLLDVTDIVARVLGYPMRNGSVLVRGVGMDMVWDTLRRTAAAMYVSERIGQPFAYQIL